MSDPCAPVIDHLAYYGYTAEALEGRDNHSYLRHSRMPNFHVSPLMGGCVLTSFYTAKVARGPLESFAVDLNRELVCGKVFVDSDGDLALRFWYPIPYARASFATWYAAVEADISELFSHEAVGEMLR